MKKSITISLFVGIVISAAALFFAFKNVPFRELVSYLGSINYFWVIPAVILILVAFMLRALRWQIILQAACRLKFRQAFHPMMIGFMANCILPGRVGEVLRPAVLLKNEKVPFATGLATVAAERVFDIGTLIVFFAFVLAKIQIDPALRVSYGGYHLDRDMLMAASSGTLKLCLILIAGIVLFSIENVRQLIRKAILKLPVLIFPQGGTVKDKIDQKICLPVIRLMDNFAVGFSMLKSPRMILACLALSVSVWFFSALSYYVMALGCPGIGLSFVEISAVMIIICFFIALPSVPGFWGIWEAGGVFALTIFGVPARESAGFTLANHAVQMFPVIIVGFISAIITGINIWRMSREIGAR